MNKVLKRVLINKELFYKTLCAISGGVFTITSVFLSFFSFEDIGIHTPCCKLLLILGLFAVVVLFAIIRVNVYKTKTIVNESTRTITLRYGDLWNFAFSKKDKQKRIVVVNVNTTFDTIVDSADVDKPLVSEKTIHGQWIKQMEKHGIGRDVIDSEIEKSLNSQKIIPQRIITYKKRGKQNSYPKGTIARYTYKDTVFYLIALSEFDENNNAHNSIEELRITIEKLIDYIDKYGQALDVYVPLMGTGKSRTYGINDRIALELIKFELFMHKDKLHGNINVIIYEGDKDKISLGG